MCLVFTCMPGESYVFQALINSLMCWICMSTWSLILFQICNNFDKFKKDQLPTLAHQLCSPPPPPPCHDWHTYILTSPFFLQLSSWYLRSWSEICHWVWYHTDAALQNTKARNKVMFPTLQITPPLQPNIIQWLHSISPLWLKTTLINLIKYLPDKILPPHPPCRILSWWKTTLNRIPPW